jgi:L-aspartate oxidase
MRLDAAIRIGVPPAPPATTAGDPDKLRSRLQEAMTTGAGVLRSASSLQTTLQVIDEVASQAGADPALANMTSVGRALITAALRREESRGNHTRTDFPEPHAEFACRIVVQ